MKFLIVFLLAFLSIEANAQFNPPLQVKGTGDSYTTVFKIDFGGMDLSFSGNVATVSATNNNTNGAVVVRDGSGNFSAGTITAALSGNASTATALAANPTDCGANTFAQSIAANGDLTCAAVTLSTADVTGTLAVGNGGTGATSLTDNRLLLGNGTSPVGVLAAGSAGQILQSAGASDPAWSTATYPGTAGNAGAVMISDGTNFVSGAVDLADTDAVTGVLPVANGGTGVAAPYYIMAILGGANASLGTASVSSYTEITDAGLTLTPITGSAAVGVMCSGTNAATAPSTSPTTCAAGSESVGINFTITLTGPYEVCFQSMIAVDVPSGSAVAGAFQLIQTPTNAQTLTLEGGAKVGWGAGGSVGTNVVVQEPFMTCSIFNFSTTGTKGVRLMYEQLVTTSVTSVTLTMNENASIGQRNGYFSVKRLF